MLMLFSASLIAKNEVMVLGKTYLILEEDLLDVIKTRVVEMQKNGMWQQIQKKTLQIVKKKILRPERVLGITRSTVDRTWHYNPSLRVPYDLSDIEGHIFAKAGESVNPLNYVSLKNALIFFDSDDEQQVNFIKKLSEGDDQNAKFILVNGDIQKTSNSLKRPIYYDQKGLLTTKFNIKHVPAIVRQEALHLTITEVVP